MTKLFEELNLLDIHSINILSSNLAKPYGRLLVTVEQGFIDKSKCRSQVKHVFYADTLEQIMDMTLSRAKATYYVGVNFPIIEEVSNDHR